MVCAVTLFGVLFALDFAAFERLSFYSLLLLQLSNVLFALDLQLSNVLLSVYSLLVTFVYFFRFKSGCDKQVNVAKQVL